jgi:hypothetical protein
MTEVNDPYEVLGVSRSAGPEEIRRAFHTAVLQCHPDLCEGDMEEVHRRFGRVVGAYRRLRAVLVEQNRDDGVEIPIPDAFNPADFTRLTAGWEYRGPADGLPPAKLDWLPNVVQQKVIQATVNETRTFVLFWVLAILLGLGVGVAVLFWRGGFEDEGMILAVLAMLATYAGVFVLALVGIVASRKTEWLLRVIGFRKQHSLPAPPKKRRLP